MVQLTTTNPIEPRRRWYQRMSWLVLLVFLFAAVIYSASSGAFHVTARQVFHVIWDREIARLESVAGWDDVSNIWNAFADLPVVDAVVNLLGETTDSFRSWLTPAYSPRDAAVIWDIRLPRVMLGACIGGLIALGSILIQAAFRNPLADPGMTGISAAGAWAALLVSLVPGWAIAGFGIANWSLRVTQPIFASFACLLVIVLLWSLAHHEGSIESISFVLTGIAVNAVLIAAIGLTNALNGDVLQQATSFWATGGLTQADWYAVTITSNVLGVAWVGTFWTGRFLNVVALGDREATHVGIDVFALRLGITLIASVLLGFAAAYAGAIAFVGLIVPQMLRIWIGPDLRRLIPQSVLAGAIAVVIVDLIARTVAQPVEVGIGLVLTLVGGPVFILLMLQMRRRRGGWI